MIGIDLIKTSRMERFMERFGEKALLRFLSPNEISLIKNHRNAAGFWASKEACSKALGTGIGQECSFHDIEIYKSEKGAPHIKLAHHLVEKYHISDISLSITHDGEYAIAVVAIEKKVSSTSNKI